MPEGSGGLSVFHMCLRNMPKNVTIIMVCKLKTVDNFLDLRDDRFAGFCRLEIA